MRKEDADALELHKAAVRLGIGHNISAAQIMASIVNDADVNPRIRRIFIRGIVTIYKKAGILGQYLEHEPEANTVWSRFYALISETASEMALERRG